MASSSSSEAQEAAARERIIKHMNADHQHSLRRYLETSVHPAPPSRALPSARMTSISPTSMTLGYTTSNTPKTHTIAFSPPLASLSQARERLVQLDADALRTLHRDPVTITTFIPPTAHAGHLFNFSVCLTTYLVFGLFPGVFAPGSVVWGVAPRFAAWCAGWRWLLVGIMAAIHAVETVLMVRLLAKHGVKRGNGGWVWWAWVATSFVEGATSFWRIEGWVKERRREKEGKKH
ncbi:hypothetical protein BDV95DRAFT_593585 [Massariosphaeria phaeospora]|uniref:DUF2470 domain-containing protein n=1 Tax=Massariosphaeria phaeospora TaxID=100035 RepID=A0A7C8IA92_9PLEO|nr:hypothetical protein BDV95DRAFT_593585 [Massariosphaeria phaeospora]